MPPVDRENVEFRVRSAINEIIPKQLDNVGQHFEHLLYIIF